MSDESALLAAILAHPDEDTPRLMYADWLQENGQPERAEFIRLQIELTREYTVEGDNRQFDIQERNRVAWAPHLPLDHSDRWAWYFTRGMPEELRCEAAAYFEHHRKLTAGSHIRELTLIDASVTHLVGLAEIGWPASVISLGLQECSKANRFGLDYDCTNGIVSLVSSGRMCQLRSLRFQMYGISDIAVRAIVDSPNSAQLASLTIRYCEVSLGAQELLRERFGSGFNYVDW